MKTLILSWLLVLFAFPALAGDKHDVIYDRIIKTEKIRCGYVVAEALNKDPNTGEISGIIPDILNEAARLLNFEIEWVEELNWSNFVVALESGRVDAVCTNFWLDPSGSKYVSYTVPLYFSGVGVYVREGDNRFTVDNLYALDDASIRVSTSDGEMASIIAAQDYPKATVVAIPQFGNSSQQLLEVSSGKADVTFVDVAIGKRYMQNNPGKVKNITPHDPVRLFANTIALPPNEPRFKNMIDAALLQLLYGGYIDRVLDKHEDVSQGYYRVSKPYEVAR